MKASVASHVIYHPTYKASKTNAHNLFQVFKAMEEDIEKHFSKQVVEKTTIIFKPIKSTKVVGLYRFSKNLVSIDHRVSCNVFLDTLCHELVHADQHLRGDLTATNFQYLWKSESFSHLKYKDLLWEIEAFQRGNDISKKIIKKWFKEDPIQMLKWGFYNPVELKPKTLD